MEKRPNLYFILREDQEKNPLAESIHQKILDQITILFTKHPPWDEQESKNQKKEVSL